MFLSWHHSDSLHSTQHLALKLHPFLLIAVQYITGFTYFSDRVFPASTLPSRIALWTPLLSFSNLMALFIFSLQMTSHVYPHLQFFILNTSPMFLHPDNLHLDISLASQIRTITIIIFPFRPSPLPMYHSHLGLNSRVILSSHLCVFDSSTFVPSHKPGTASWMGMWFNHGLGDGREVGQRVREAVLRNIFPVLRRSLLFSGHYDFRIWYLELSLPSCY